MADETIAQKKCGRCAEVKPLGEFYANRCKPDGKAAICKSCHNHHTARWNEKNPERKRLKQLAWGRAHKDKHKEYKVRYKTRNRDKALESGRESTRRFREKRPDYMREWLKSNPDAVRANGARRRAALVSATPWWADLEKMRAVYREAVRLERETGVPLHVDHIVPLQGRNVCGLHVHYNLQILTAEENVRKHNRFEGDA